jgi:hypothetical protein
VSRLLVVDWVPRSGPWHDALMFVFDAGVLPPGALERAVLPVDELRAVHLTTLPDAAAHLRPAMLRRLAAALEVAADPGAPPRYLQDGHRVW